jgi:hypothetical protein
MQTKQFNGLIQIVTGRDLTIKTNDLELEFEKEYYVFRKLPITGRTVSFYWKTPKSDEKMLRSFITAFCSKYREPNPAKYGPCSIYTEAKTWDQKTEEEREHCYMHHSTNMYSKERLLEQVQANFNSPEITDGLIKYGFYPTEYGVGIFVVFETDYVKRAVNAMYNFLKKKGIPFSNEYSDARWVFRFKLNLTKQVHQNLLTGFVA